MASKNKSNFFTKDTPHGYIKRLMYKKYLQAYIAKTQSGNGYRTVIIDGFAGVGLYENQWPEAIEGYGSPLIAVMVALRFLRRKLGLENIVFVPPTSVTGSEPELKINKKPDIRPDNIPGTGPEPVLEMDNIAISLFFIEKDKTYYQQLVSNVKRLLVSLLGKYFPDPTYSEHHPSDGHVIYRPTSVSIQIAIFHKKFTEFKPPSELSEENIRSLTFLDPFKYTQMPMDHVALFASGKGHELFITFMSSSVNKYVSKHPGHVDALCGIDEENMLEDTQAHFAKRLISLNERRVQDVDVDVEVNKWVVRYEKNMKKQTGSEFALSFEVRGPDNAILYHMIHITNHPKGREAMKEAMNRCSQTKDKMTMSDFNILTMGHELNLGNCDDQNRVADAIFNEFAGQLNVRIDTVSDFVCRHESSYVYRKEPLAILQKDGRITDVRDNKGHSPMILYKFPDHTKWFISFQARSPTR